MPWGTVLMFVRLERNLEALLLLYIKKYQEENFTFQPGLDRPILILTCRLGLLLRKYWQSPLLILLKLNTPYEMMPNDANMSHVISLAQCVPLRPLGPRFSRIHRNTIGTQWTVPTVPALPQGHVSHSFHVAVTLWPGTVMKCKLSGGSKRAKEH